VFTGKVGIGSVGETKWHQILTTGTKQWLPVHFRFVPIKGW